MISPRSCREEQRGRDPPPIKHMVEPMAFQRFTLLDAKPSLMQVSRGVFKPPGPLPNYPAWTAPHGPCSPLPGMPLRATVAEMCQNPSLHLSCLILNAVFQPPPKWVCLQKEPRGEVQPTNKNIIITQFSSTWASPGYSPGLRNSIVSPSRPYLIG